MSSEIIGPLVAARPRRADALRNYQKLVDAAREAFAQDGADTSLEEVARRAGVGIATLYRNFPERAALLEAVYLEDVEIFCTSSADVSELPAWDAFAEWLRRLTSYLVNKQALAPVLLRTFDHDAPVFDRSRAAFFAVGEPLLHRAQEAQEVRADTDLAEVIQLVGAIAKIPASGAAEIGHILEMALDGLRYRPGNLQS